MFGKRNTSQTEELLGEVLDAQDADVLIVRGESCQILFANTSARERLKSEGLSLTSCRDAYGSIFRDICSHCPNRDPSQENEEPTFFSMSDDQQRTFAISGNSIAWTDKYLANVLFFRDITKDSNLDKKLYSLAYTDQLTGVPNRTKLHEDASDAIANAEYKNLCGAIAMFDLDNFKTINDTYGHNTGDVMLRKITEHLQEDARYNGHLYRLGGDEFVLYFTVDPKDFHSEEDFRKYYGELLEGAFFSYTLPNIEFSCTISMGVSFFPLHGTTLSELLRKADIALYEAKAAGRNRMVFFEDKYDAAKKFKSFYINIQPILSESGDTYGYELIDSGNEPNENEEETPNSELSLNEFDRTLDALGLDDIGSSARYFIAYTPMMINSTVLRNLPKDKFIIQMQVPGVCTQKEIALYKQLRLYGYKLALAGLHSSNITTELLQQADYCKFAPDKLPPLAQRKIISENKGKWFIALDIDTKEAYETAKAAGFKLFQGMFFNQPTVVQKTKDIEPLKANYYRLLKLTSTSDYVDFAQISDIISSDVALSYKLLRLLNSAAVGLRNRISSISMAVSYLGEESLKKWVSLLALRGVASDKPLELVRLSLIRAQFGELLAPHMRPRRDTKHVFLTGMFSLLHIALEKTPEQMLAEIPVADAVHESLLSKDGPYSDLIQFFSDYEYSNWDEVTRFADANGLSSSLVYESYIEAVKWYNDLMDG